MYFGKIAVPPGGSGIRNSKKKQIKKLLVGNIFGALYRQTRNTLHFAH
jgi:hypothetical protein